MMEHYTFSHTVFILKTHPALSPDYVLWALRRRSVVEWLLREMNSNTGVPTLGKAVLEAMPLPIPPLAEQHRIVARLETLLAHIDTIDRHLTTQAEAHAAFAAAAVHHIDT